MLHTLSVAKWDESFSATEQASALKTLEQGQIIYCPQLNFKLAEGEDFFLAAKHADPYSKNISYHPLQHKLWGVQRLTDRERIKLKSMMDRFAHYAYKLVHHLLPQYSPYLTIARTSFRPVQISNRKTSILKDDKRLHIDAFPSAPNQGKRIFRVFSNINRDGEDRVWRVGETFEKLLDQFSPELKKQNMLTPHLLRLLRITKSYRTPYDHYMLQIHNLMKKDEHYQQKAEQQVVRFPPGSTWIVQTDHVSHSVLQGQHVLEQTFYLPVTAMQDQARSPLRILETRLNQKLA